MTYSCGCSPRSARRLPGIPGSGQCARRRCSARAVSPRVGLRTRGVAACTPQTRPLQTTQQEPNAYLLVQLHISMGLHTSKVADVGLKEYVAAVG